MMTLSEWVAGQKGDPQASADAWLTILSSEQSSRPFQSALELALGHGCRLASARVLAEDGLRAAELTLAGGELEALGEAARGLRSELVDASLLPDSVRNKGIRLLVMDMDSTLVRQEGIDELAREVGVYRQVAEVTSKAMRGEMDFRQALRQRCACLKGAPESVFRRVRERARLADGARRLLAALRSLGCRTALVSGGFVQLGSALARRLGFDHFHANELEVRKGRLTGRLKGAIVDGKRKAQLLEELAGRHGLSLPATAAMGDGANDLPMLKRAGMGIAFDAKPEVRRQAPHTIHLPRLDAALYLMGFSDPQIDRLTAPVSNRKNPTNSNSAND